jgi:hypothetical protein
MLLGLPQTGMNPSKKGLSSAGKTGVVVLLIVIVLAAAYLVPSLSKGGGSQSSNSSAVRITGMLPLVMDFPKMQVTFDGYDSPNGIVTNESYAYAVLGTSTLYTTTTTTEANGSLAKSTSSTQYTRVEFTTAGVGVGQGVIIWYNSSGGIGDEEVLGERNYTGNGVNNLPFMVPYTSSFGGLVSITNNSTLLSLLTKTAEATTSIGPTQMDVTTYVLEARSPPYSSLTVKIATIPGTNVQFVVYVNEKVSDGSTSLLQVTSLTR